MRVLVSGGAGYIGSHTVLALLEGGHDVVIVDDFANSKPTVLGRLEAPPSSKAARDKDDPLYFARSKEVVSLWRLGSSA